MRLRTWIPITVELHFLLGFRFSPASKGFFFEFSICFGILEKNAIGFFGLPTITLQFRVYLPGVFISSPYLEFTSQFLCFCSSKLRTAFPTKHKFVLFYCVSQRHRCRRRFARNRNFSCDNNFWNPHFSKMEGVVIFSEIKMTVFWFTTHILFFVLYTV